MTSTQLQELQQYYKRTQSKYFNLQINRDNIAKELKVIYHYKTDKEVEIMIEEREGKIESIMSRILNEIEQYKTDEVWDKYL